LVVSADDAMLSKFGAIDPVSVFANIRVLLSTSFGETRQSCCRIRRDIEVAGE
jgi:hypothetical protein